MANPKELSEYEEHEALFVPHREITNDDHEIDPDHITGDRIPTRIYGKGPQKSGGVEVEQ